MVRGRRWPLAEFRDLFVNHPLVWHIVRRLVLSAGHDKAGHDKAQHDGTTTTFRIAEDRTFADIDDEAITLPGSATIGIPHPLDLSETLHPWSELFADYEILQPFAQLGRAVHTLSESERATGRLARFEGVTVPVGKVLGLQRRGWDRGEPQDSGVEPWISREVVPGHYVTIGLDPGIAAGAVEWFPEQKLASVGLGPDPNAHGRPATAAPSFDGLPATAVSEVLSDLAWLTEPTT
jgi:hypothetical protein